jgi:hypothetical protein
MFSSAVYDTTLDWLLVFDSTALPSVPLLLFRLQLHSGGNSLGEISRLLRLSKTTVHQIVKVPAKSSEAFTRIIISGFMRHR